jgi:hypothetical protein
VPEMQQALQVKYGNQNSNVKYRRDHLQLHRRPQLHHSLWANVHPGRGRGPATVRGVGGRGAPYAGRQPGRDDPSDTADSFHTVRDHRCTGRERLRRRVRESGRADPDPARDRALPGVRQQPRPIILHSGQGQRAGGTRHGRSGAGAQAAAQDPPWRRE